MRQASRPFASINLHTIIKSHCRTHQPTGNRSSEDGSQVLLRFGHGTVERRDAQYAIHKVFDQRFLAALMLIGSVMFFPARIVKGQEPNVEVFTQDTTVSAPGQAGISLISPLPFHLSLGAHVGYDNNSRTSAGGGGSFFTRENAALSYALHKERTQLDIRSGASLYYFTKRTTAQVNSFLDVSLVHNLSLRLKLDASAYAAYRTEPDFSSDVGIDNVRGNYFHTLDTLSATYHWWSRFSTVTTYKFRLIEYDDSSVRASINRCENTFAEEFRFNLLRRTTLTGEYRFGVIDYDTAPRDSLTHYLLAGVDHNLTSRLHVVVRGGASLRSYIDDGDRTNPHFEGSVTYSGAHHAAVSWTTRYGVEETNLSNVLSRTTFRTGLQASYNISARVISTASVFYRHDKNEGLGVPGMSSPGFLRDSIYLSLGLRYSINRHFAVDLNYTRTEVSSDQSAASSTGDYSRDRYTAGVTFTY